MGCGRMEGAQNLMPISSQAELVNILVCIEIRQKCGRVVMSCQFQLERDSWDNLSICYFLYSDALKEDPVT